MQVVNGINMKPVELLLTSGTSRLKEKWGGLWTAAKVRFKFSWIHHVKCLLGDIMKHDFSFGI